MKNILRNTVAIAAITTTSPALADVVNGGPLLHGGPINAQCSEYTVTIRSMDYYGQVRGRPSLAGKPLWRLSNGSVVSICNDKTITDERHIPWVWVQFRSQEEPQDHEGYISLRLLQLNPPWPARGSDTRSYKMTCTPESTHIPYDVTYKNGAVFITGSVTGGTPITRRYNVIDFKDNGSVLYIASNARGQTRTVYLTFNYLQDGDDVSALRVIDGNKDSRDKCVFESPTVREKEPQAQLHESPPVREQPQDQQLQEERSAQTSREVAQLEKQVTTLQEQIAKQNFANQKQQELQDQVTELQRKLDQKKKLADAKNALNEEEANAKEWAAKIEEAKVKGIDYLNKSGSAWALKEVNDPMSDEVDSTAVSAQDNGKGVVAEISGMCRFGQVMFTAVLNSTTDDPLRFAEVEGGYVIGRKRINDDPPVPVHFDTVKWSNQILISSLDDKSLYTTWRILAEVETSQGDIIIKIPMFDPNIQKVVTNCKKIQDSSKIK
jgi:hypothetical protein